MIVFRQKKYNMIIFSYQIHPTPFYQIHQALLNQNQKQIKTLDIYKKRIINSLEENRHGRESKHQAPNDHSGTISRVGC
jgi:hypothetical protein